MPGSDGKRDRGGAGDAATRAAPTRRRPVQLLSVLLLALLGFGFAVGLRTNRDTAELANVRQEDLVRILADLDAREERLRLEVADLQRTRDELAVDPGGAVALEEARRRATELGILAGTLPAVGPGVVLTIEDPSRQVRANLLVDVIHELRNAGAETIDLSGVRLGADSAVVDVGGRVREGVRVDGTVLTPPYVFTAIGDPETMATALAIPGGIVDTAAASGARATVIEADALEVRSLRPVPEPEYARPAPG